MGMVWELITSKQYPLFSRLWVHESFLYDMKETLGMNFRMYKSLYNGTYAEGKEVDRLRSLLVSQLEKDINTIREIGDNWRKDCNELLEYTKPLEKINFSDYSDNQIIELLGNGIKKLRRSASYIYLSVVLDTYFQNWLNNLLDSKISGMKKRIIYFQLLTSPTKKTQLHEAKKKLIEIADIVKNNGLNKAERLIKDYTRQYKWLGYDTGVGKDLTIEDTKRRVSTIVKQKKSVEKAENRETILAELNLAKKDEELLEIMDEIIYLRAFRAESNMIAGSHIRPILEEFAKRLNVTYDNLVHLTFDEIKESIKTKKVGVDEIERRKNKYGLLMIDGKNTIYSGNQVEKIEEKVEVPSGLKVLKGLVANHGNIKGHVKIVLSHKDFAKIEFGDILVTKMTNPDFIVVLEQCSGIITDIGGITSHAAIIARELDKPCITGTIYATKILRDGDLVEFNTDKGTIKIVKDN